MKQTILMALFVTLSNASYAVKTNPQIQGSPHVEINAEIKDAITSDTEIQNTQTYDAPYFTQYNPQTARDIIDRIPGFTLDLGSDARGFGATAGNVLINNQRPSSKSGGLTDALNRLPANSVIAVELLAGSANLSDTAGKTVVANIITSSDSAAASWMATLQQNANEKIYGSGELALIKKIGGWETSSKINLLLEKNPLEGTRLTHDNDGTLSFGQFERRPSLLQEGFISTELKNQFTSGKLGITGRFGRSEFYADTERLGFDGQLPNTELLPDQSLLIDFDSKYNEAELGLDWTQTIANDWTWKSLFLTYTENAKQSQIKQIQQPIDGITNTTQYLRDSEQFETIFRNTLSKKHGDKVTSEVGFEMTFNRLDNLLNINQVDQEVGYQAVDVDGTDTLVDEIRKEAFYNLQWVMNDNYSLETGLAIEHSNINVSGDSSASQSFQFLKPFLTVNYQYSNDWKFRLNTRKHIAQLDLTTFAASATASQNRVLSGNATLRPEQHTRISLFSDYRVNASAVISLELFNEQRQEVIEQVILPSGGYGAGNAGEARVVGLNTQLSLPLERWVDGGLLEVSSKLRNSRYTDPITKQSRQLSEIAKSDSQVEFRQDITSHKFSWGITYLSERESTDYYVDEVLRYYRGERWHVFVQKNILSDIRATLSLRDVGARRLSQHSQFYHPSRDNLFVGSESVNRERGMSISLSFSGQI